MSWMLAIKPTNQPTTNNQQPTTQSTNQ